MAFTRIFRFPILTILLAIAMFAWGYASVRYKVPPWSWISPIEKEMREFVMGDTSEETGFAEKISNDLNLRPARQLFDYLNLAERDYVSVAVPGLNERRDNPVIFVNSENQSLPGYRFIFGTFDFDSHLHGGILLNNRNEVVNTWVVDEEAILSAVENSVKSNETGDGGSPLKSAAKPPVRRLPQGVEIFPDGSIVFNDGDRGYGIHKMDHCGNTVWSTIGHFHHAITYNRDDESIWTFGPQDMMQLNPADGQILKSISLDQLFQANPELTIFSVRRDLKNGGWHYDPIHKNDIEALPQTYAAEFAEFEPGDLVVSHRSSNLLFVFDPDNLKIKWWRAGQTRRQHDPDWQSDGSISVFDNNLTENLPQARDGPLPDGDTVRYSKIWKITPSSFKAEIVYDGKRDNMYSGERSKHQILPNGNILITSAHQGRVLEVNAEGETLFEFLNNYDDKQNLIVSEAIWLPQDFFDAGISDWGNCE